MSKSKHSEAQMIEALKQVEAGRSADEVGRSYGVSKHTVYAWKAKYGGMDVSEAQEVKALREENARLKKLVADLSLDKDALQSVIRKNHLGCSAKSGSAAADTGVRTQPAACLRAGGDSAVDASLPQPEERRCIAGTVAGVGARTTALRLSALMRIAERR